MRKKLLAFGLGLALFAAPVFSTSHFDAAEASWKVCNHGTQKLHELSNPPASWPGTRAAHTMSKLINGDYSEYVYTKSGWWDPTWDYYDGNYYNC